MGNNQNIGAVNQKRRKILQSSSGLALLSAFPTTTSGSTQELTQVNVVKVGVYYKGDFEGTEHIPLANHTIDGNTIILFDPPSSTIEAVENNSLVVHSNGFEGVPYTIFNNTKWREVPTDLDEESLVPTKLISSSKPVKLPDLHIGKIDGSRTIVKVQTKDDSLTLSSGELETIEFDKRKLILPPRSKNGNHPVREGTPVVIARNFGLLDVRVARP